MLKDAGHTITLIQSYYTRNFTPKPDVRLSPSLHAVTTDILNLASD